MAKKGKRSRLTLPLMLCGLMLAAAFLGSPHSASAFGFGGFGRMGGFGRPGFGMRPGAHNPGVKGRGGNLAGVPHGRGGRGEGSGGGARHRGVVPGGYVGVGGGAGVAAGAAGGGGGGNGSGVPPRGERRYVGDEVITAFSADLTPAAIDEIARRYNLTRLEAQNFSLLGATLYRWRIGGGRPLADVVGAIEDERGVASAQPNYVFTLQEDAAPAAALLHGDPGQYVLGKLNADKAQRVATGKNVVVAVIDSQIDDTDADLGGSIVASFDALGGQARPHRHGTAMAGAIAAHGKLLGIAPGVRLLAARAFAGEGEEAKGTSFAIYKALQWAADGGARVVNMSFAGPPDPALHRMLAAARAKGMMLIAAAGNAGPKSAPLYPAADADVVAVTATDARDGLFAMANRGDYIAVAAPGVDIIALAPDDALQITTGTSVAAAHVSAVAALLLERKPSLTPADLRAIITATAKPLGSAGRQAEYGAGLVDAYRAVLSPNGQAGKDQARQ
jgi:hypothetical protein